MLLHLSMRPVVLVILLQMEIIAKKKKKGVKLAVLLKYLSNFLRSLEIPLINCKVELSLDWFAKCVFDYWKWN